MEEAILFGTLKYIDAFKNFLFILLFFISLSFFFNGQEVKKVLLSHCLVILKSILLTNDKFKETIF